MSNVVVSVGRVSNDIATLPWQTIPVLAEQIVKKVQKQVGSESGEKIFIACNEKQAIAIFSRNRTEALKRVSDALREIESLMGSRPLALGLAQQIAS